MEISIPSWLFFSVWAVICIVFLHLGLASLDKRHASYSVSPVVMSFVKHSLAIISFFSSSYALIFRPLPRDDMRLRVLSSAGPKLTLIICALCTYLVLIFIGWVLNFFLDSALATMKTDIAGAINEVIYRPTDLYRLPWFYHLQISVYNIMFSAIILPKISPIPELKFQFFIHIVMETSLFWVSEEKTMFFSLLVLLISFWIPAISFWIPAIWAETVAAKAEKIFSFLAKKWGKIFEFAIGTVGALLFDNFFQVESFNQALPILYLAVMWLANLALLGSHCDFGVLYFLLGVVMDVTFKQFGHHTPTWLVGFFYLFLGALHLMLQSLTFEYGPAKRIRVI